MAPNIFGSGSKIKGNGKASDSPAPNVKKPDESEKTAPSPKPIHRRSFSLEFSLSSLITVGIFILIAFGFVFAFGLMLGRGYNPEEQVSEITGFMPMEESELGIDHEDTLRPEDLEFMTALKQDDLMGLPDDVSGDVSGDLVDGKSDAKGKESGTLGKAANELGALLENQPDKPDPVVQATDQAAREAEERKLAESRATEKLAKRYAEKQAVEELAADLVIDQQVGQLADKVVENIKPAEALMQDGRVQKDPKRSADNGYDAGIVYDFVYQVVAYKHADQAEQLRARLEVDGFRTRTHAEETAAGKVQWYRVQVLFRGTVAQAAANKTRFARFGIKGAVIVSQERVGR